MSKVVELLSNNALCVDQESLAARIRQFADRVESGEFGAVERAIIMVEKPDGRMAHRVYGRPTTTMEMIGLLEWCKARVMGLLE